MNARTVTEKKPALNRVLPSEKILRFRKSERRLHWAIAIPFMICMATAMVLVVFYNPNPLRSYRNIVSWVHRISGICLVILPIMAIFRSRGDFRVYFYNIKQAWVWSLQDIKWLMLMGLAQINKKIKLPDQGKFNAAEKINFMTLMATLPIYILTGVVIWFTDGALLYWMIHFGMALLALPLIGGHIFMATINPDTKLGLSGMFSGMVDREWAKHHYTAWYHELFEDHKVAIKFRKNTYQKPVQVILADEDNKEWEEVLQPVKATGERFESPPEEVAA